MWQYKVNILVVLLVQFFENTIHAERFCCTRKEDGLVFPALYQVTPPLDHGECPFWDHVNHKLYFVDLFLGKVFCYQPKLNRITSILMDGEVAPIIPTKHKNEFIAGRGRTLVSFKWDGESHHPQDVVELITVSTDRPTSRFNDGKVDSKGRLWIGTMGYESPDGVLTPNEGRLYKFFNHNYNNSVPIIPIPIIPTVNVSNGLAWNKANTKFYYIDSPTKTVVAYDFISATGDIANPQVIFDLRWYPELSHAVPDGMTIDKDDKLWVALYGAGSVIHVNPETKELIARYPIPAQYVTSVMFGGEHLDILYVTTSRYRLSELERGQQPGAGATYALTELGTTGRPMQKAKHLLHKGNIFLKF